MSKSSGKTRPTWMHGSGEPSAKPEETEEATPRGGVETRKDHDSTEADQHTETMHGAGENAEEIVRSEAQGGRETGGSTVAERASLGRGPARLQKVVLESDREGGYDPHVLSEGSAEEASGDRGEVGRRSAQRFVERASRETAPTKLAAPEAGAGKPRLWEALARITRLFEAAGSSAGTGMTARPEATPEAMSKDTPEVLIEELRRRLLDTTVGSFSRFCVGSWKGGVGKSSVAYAVAGAIASCTNLNVAIVDADPNFGASRKLIPSATEPSVLDLARDAEEVASLSELSAYTAQNNRLRLDAVLRPRHAYELAEVEDLGALYEKVDRVLSHHYHVVVYDLGIGFSDPAIRRMLDLADELLLVTDSEAISAGMIEDAVAYLQRLGIDPQRRTLAINHRLPASHESADTAGIREAAEEDFRRVGEIPYDAAFSQGLNHGSFHIEDLQQDTRLGVLTAAATALEGLRRNSSTRDATARASAEQPAKRNRARKGA